MMVKFFDLVDPIKGVSYKPKDLKDNYDENSFYLLRSNNIKSSNVLLKEVQIVHDAAVRNNQKLSVNDIVVCMSNGSKQLVGKNAVFKEIHGQYCVGAFCAAFRPKADTVSDFIFQLFQSDEYQNLIDVTLAGSAINNLKSSDLLNFDFDIPSKYKQFKIAKILNAADVVIEKTEAAIDKYRAIKQGMMQDLFTRGIDLQTGQLRPTYKDAPHLYKETELGWTPKEWEVKFLKNITVKIADRDHFTPTYFEDGVPIISPKDFDENDKITFGKCKFISLGAHLKNRKKTNLETNDLVFTRIGAGLGKVCMVESWMPEFSILHSACMIKVDQSKMISRFLEEFIKSSVIQRQIKVEVQSIGVPDLGLDKINSFKVFQPDIEEQKLISHRFQSINATIFQEIFSLNKYKNFKKGLMQDLLTGRVEVEV